MPLAPTRKSFLREGHRSLAVMWPPFRCGLTRPPALMVSADRGLVSWSALADQQVSSAVYHSADCCSVVFKGTKRIDGRLTASQIASASATSCLLRLTYAFT